MDPLEFCGYASISDIPSGFDNYDVLFAVEVEGGILDRSDCPGGYDYHGEACWKFVSLAANNDTPSAESDSGDNIPLIAIIGGGV